MSDIFEAGERELDEVLRAIVPDGTLIGCRWIRAGDESLLTPAERPFLMARPPMRRRASGAARHVARALCRRLDHPDADILSEPSGAPRWPDGLLGSLAHDDEFAVAVVTRADNRTSLGIDVEPAEPLPPEVEALVRIGGDHLAGIDAALEARLLFSAKEAVYKAAFPLDGIILNYDDIAVDFRFGLAETTTGHRLGLSWLTGPRIVTLAWA